MSRRLCLIAQMRERLPTTRQFKAVLQKHQQLLKLARAKQLHSYSGPVLLFPRPAGLLFHESVGHRLEGSRLLSSDEGQTFRGLEGKRVLNVDVDVIDNPQLKRLHGERCVGAYDYDDEGAPAKNAVLIEGGVLKGFLNTRTPASDATLNLTDMRAVRSFSAR